MAAIGLSPLCTRQRSGAPPTTRARTGARPRSDRLMAVVDQRASRRVGAEHEPSDAGVFMLAAGAVGTPAGVELEFALGEVAEELVPLAVGGFAAFLRWSKCSPEAM